MVFSTDSPEFSREAFGVKIEISVSNVIVTAEVQSQDMADAFTGSVDILTRAFSA